MEQLHHKKRTLSGKVLTDKIKHTARFGLYPERTYFIYIVKLFSSCPLAPRYIKPIVKPSTIKHSQG